MSGEAATVGQTQMLCSAGTDASSAASVLSQSASKYCPPACDRIARTVDRRGRAHRSNRVRIDRRRQEMGIAVDASKQRAPIRQTLPRANGVDRSDRNDPPSVLPFAQVSAEAAPTQAYCMLSNDGRRRRRRRRRGRYCPLSADSSYSSRDVITRDDNGEVAGDRRTSRRMA